MAKLYEEGFTQNREISWLRYNERVLEEAFDETVPLFERLNFISIFCSNLEEFFQVRVGSLITDEEDGDDSIDSRSGMSAAEQLDAIYKMIPELYAKMDQAYNVIDASLRDAGVVRLNVMELSEEELGKALSFCLQYKDGFSVRMLKQADEMPILTSNKQYFISRLVNDNDCRYALFDAGRELPSIYVLDDGLLPGSKLRYVVCSDVIKALIPQMHKPFTSAETVAFSITRNGDVEADEDAETLLEEMKSIVEQREISPADKLCCDSKLSSDMRDFLLEAFGLEEDQLYSVVRASFRYVGDLKDVLPPEHKERLCYMPFVPFNQLSLMNKPVMEYVKKKDLLSAYPFDSMDPLLELLKEASESDKVKEIRMTIYRLSSNPVIVDHLLNAVNNGKKVKILIELRARNDEAKNIDWAQKLSDAGCKVYYGDDEYKVHSKLCQIVIDERDEKKFISQISTGNYNEKSAKSYTDFSLITYDQRIGKDINEFFEDVFKHKEGKYDHILTSPKTMHQTVINLIRREAKKGSKGRIFIKVNAVTDSKLIEELMEASCAGCKVRMIVRGICCILPGVEFCTENIEIVNLVGRLLEHSRVYIFGEGDDEMMYISSADFMTRNMLRRVEVACPIYNSELRERIRAILYLNFIDDVKGRRLRRDGCYEIKESGQTKTDSQDLLIKQSQLV